MRLFTVLAAAAAMAMPAGATTIFSQNFDAVAVRNNATTIPGFTISGQVDVIRTGQSTISCFAGIGRCVDLVGSNNVGSITTTGINFIGGKLITVAFDLSGNPRATPTDDVFNFALNFTNPETIAKFTLGNSFQAPYGGTGTRTGFGTYTETIVRNRQFKSYVLSFIPTSAGTLRLTFGAGGPNDSAGPILDNVSVTSTVVPEPSNWMMLIAGFGLVGLASRRRRKTVSA